MSDIRDVFKMVGEILLQPTIDHATEVRGYLDKEKLTINVISPHHMAVYRWAKKGGVWEMIN